MSSTGRNLASLGNAARNGLLLHHLLGCLQRLGVEIDPFYLLREYPETEERDKCGIDTAISSSLLVANDTAAVIAASGPLATYNQLRDRLGNGHKCVIVKHEDDAIGYTWINPHEISHANYRRSLEPDEVYLYGAYILPEFRGRGLAPLMRAECYRHLRRLGMRRMYSISGLFNTPAIRFKQKLRAEFLAIYLRLKIGPVELEPLLVRTYRRFEAGISKS